MFVDKGRKKNGLNKINSLVSFESIHKGQSLSSPSAIGYPVDKIDHHYSKVSKEDYWQNMQRKINIKTLFRFAFLIQKRWNYVNISAIHNKSWEAGFSPDLYFNRMYLKRSLLQIDTVRRFLTHVVSRIVCGFEI